MTSEGTLDLEGGSYSLSRPLLIPQHYGNFRVMRGTLFAGPAFPLSSPDDPENPESGLHFLLQVGQHGSCNSTTGGASNKNCNTDVGIEQVTLDGRGLANGLMIADTMDSNVGPALLVVGFPHIGISLAGSGAGYIHEAWLGQYPAGSKTPRGNATATAIMLAGDQHDCDVNNVIIFSGKVGVNSTNGANRLQGVHTWNLVGSQGGVGIVLHTGSGRVEQSYLDYAPLVIRETGSMGLTMVEGNLFLGSSTIVLQAVEQAATLHGLIVTGNVFRSWNKANHTFVLDESAGKFVNVTDTVVENNQVGPSVVKLHGKQSTRATMAATVPRNSRSLSLDFSEALLFGSTVGIHEANCWLNVKQSCHFAPGISSEATSESTTVVVTLSEPAPSTEGCQVEVTCAVDQSARITPAH